jgi:hypothetical protein
MKIKFQIQNKVLTQNSSMKCKYIFFECVVKKITYNFNTFSLGENLKIFTITYLLIQIFSSRSVNFKVIINMLEVFLLLIVP